MNDKRIIFDDLRLFPVQDFFNSIPDYTFVQTVNRLTQSIGHTFDEVTCAFPSDLNLNEPTFDGVRFSLFEDNVVITRAQLYDILFRVCQDFIKRFPETQILLDHYLARISSWKSVSK